MSLRKILALAASMFTLALAAHGQQSPPYGTLTPPQPTEGGGKIEVVEFFWYGCPHCYHLEPQINAWLKTIPQDVVFRRVHAIIPSPAWAAHAQIFYTLQAMGLVDKLHQKVFDAIHKDNINLADPKSRAEWLARNGVDPAKYAEVEKSFSVATNMQRARLMTAQYKVDGVPRIFVNGRWYTAPEFAGDRTFAVVNDLIAMARKEGVAAGSAKK